MTGRLLNVVAGALVGFGLVLVVVGDIGLGVSCAALGALYMAVESVLTSYTWKRWRLERRRAKCDHDFEPHPSGLDRCRKCTGLGFAPPVAREQ